jgi:dTDP-4-amino-4,6-dideoxygalactose transaminase
MARSGTTAHRAQMSRVFGGREVVLYPSGTAALASALARCAANSATRFPEAILPAYGCPDLVSACVAASVFPRLVDLQPSAWKYDRAALTRSFSSDVIAIVAVNLLGIGDDAVELAAWARENRIALIQDSAQFLPRTPRQWPGDYIVLSFGRGKPLNLLHGGALIARSAAILPDTPPGASISWRDRLRGSRLAALAFNALTLPMPYRAIAALPGMGLGEVRYKELRNGGALPDREWNAVGAAFDLYQRKPSYSDALWSPALEKWRAAGVSRLTCPDESPDREPLRLALLARDKSVRDVVVTKLNARGLGASMMYRSSLDAIAGVPDAVRDQGPFPNASGIADRLFTLPTHSLVAATAIARTTEIVLSCARA